VTNNGETNPKVDAATRDGKAPLDLLENTADEAIAWALKDGATKYGKQNYRTIPIYMSTYAAAIRRHVGAWLDGEDDAADSGLHHLAHVGANLHVVFGAMDAGTLVDDRGPQERSPEQEARSTASNGQHSRGLGAEGWRERLYPCADCGKVKNARPDMYCGVCVEDYQ